MQVHPEPSRIPLRNESSNQDQGNWNKALNELRESLQDLGGVYKTFPPLFTTVESLVSCLNNFEKSLKSCQELQDLTVELAAIVRSLERCTNGSHWVLMSNSTTNVTMAIEEDILEIRVRLNRASKESMAGRSMDQEGLVRHYRRIQSHFQQLQKNASMCAWSIANEQLAIPRLESLSPVKEAAYDSSISVQISRRGCTQGTRTGVLDGLDSWLHGSTEPPIYWMNGMAGTGKTTIATTFCERTEQCKLLGASFFCTRSSAECRDVARIIPTIAYQLARYSIPFQSTLCEIMGQSPDIGSKNLLKQFEKLLKEPLERAKDAIPGSLVVVIDALDECDDRNGVELVLDMLFRHMDYIPLKFFVTSRPEQEIYQRMSINVQLREVLHLHNIEQSLVQGDIELYLKEELEAILPSQDEIDQLVERSGTLFIYAATLVRYISGKRSVDSRKRLKTVFDLTTQSTRQYAQIDTLYTAVLDSALHEDELLEADEVKDVLTVLWIVLLAQEPVSVEIIGSLGGLENLDVVIALQFLRSVIYQSEDSGLVSTFHASFSDFMFSSERSGSYSCDIVTQNQILSQRCFSVMLEQLRFNICDLRSSFVPDGKVENVHEQIRLRISPILSYACRYWSSHLILAPHLDILLQMLQSFLSHRLLFWMEVLNLQRNLSLGVNGLLNVQEWLRRAESSSSELITFVDDVRSFVTGFAVNPVSQSTPHIYISALAFCPESNTVHKYYRKRTQGLLELKGSLMDRREAAPLAIWSFGSEIQSLALSPDGTQVAIGCLDDTVSIFSAYDGILQIGPLQGHPNSVESIAFSPEGGRIVSASLGSIRVWNIFNGTRISGQFRGHMRYINSVSFSPDGARIVSGGHDCTVRVWGAYDSTPLLDPFTDHTGPVLRVTFSPNGTLIASASSDQTIRLWNSHDGTPTFAPLRGHTGSVNSLVFTPDGARIVSGSSDKTIRVWSTSDGSNFPITFEGYEGGIGSLAISPDGTRIVAGCNDYAIRIWKTNDGKLASGPYFGHTDIIKSVAYSPDGTRVLSGSRDKTVRVWNVPDGLFPPPPLSFLDDLTGIKSVAFCPDNTHFLSSGGHTVRIWDITDGSFVTSPSQTNFFPTPLCALSPDGHYISGTSRSGKLQITSTTDGSLVAGPFDIERTSLSTLVFSHNKRNIIMGCQDGTIKVCTLEGGNATVGSFVAHRRSVTSLSESLDCSLLVSYSDFEFTLRVWDIFAPALGLISSDGAIYEGWIITDDGWVMNNKLHLLFWLPPDIASAWCSPYAWLVITKTGTLQVPKQKPFIGDEWIKCYSPI